MQAQESLHQPSGKFQSLGRWVSLSSQEWGPFPYPYFIHYQPSAGTQAEQSWDALMVSFMHQPGWAMLPRRVKRLPGCFWEGALGIYLHQ